MVVVDRVGEPLRQPRVAGPVHVLVRGVHGRPAEPAGSRLKPTRCPSASQAAAVPGAELPRSGVTVVRWNSWPVARVPAGPSRPSSGGDEGLVAQGQPRRHHGLGVERADHRHPVDAAAEVEQPGALGDGGQAGRDGVGDGGPQRGVGAQLGGVHLGEAAAEVEPGRALGQRGVDERVEARPVRSRRRAAAPRSRRSGT